MQEERSHSNREDDIIHQKYFVKSLIYWEPSTISVNDGFAAEKSVDNKILDTSHCSVGVRASPRPIARKQPTPH